MRILAFYLPQFYRTPENDAWWGEGFTDWDAVRKAVPLFAGHDQPKVPEGDDYYDLSKVDSLRKQAGLMAKYGMDGLCFYHYYFKDGKRILEKPAELLLDNKDIQMPFCFSWANESWGRTWSNITVDNNIWTEDKDPKSICEDIDGTLMKQAYGDKPEWKEHFEYLLPFFRDERYIKVNGHPIMVIYKPGNLYCFNEMKQYWEELANEAGVGSVYFLSTNYMNSFCEHRVMQQPQTVVFCSGKQRDVADRPWRLDYSEVWEEILDQAKVSEEGICLGGFVQYDDTPRRGENGLVIEGSTPGKFGYYLKQLLEIAQVKHSEFVFLNAWNEWGEGMYIEPDKLNKKAYLEEVKKAKNAVAENGIAEEYEDLTDPGFKLSPAYSSTRDRVHSEIYQNWLISKIQGLSIAEYLRKHEYSRIAVYGMGIMGRMLAADLKNEGIDVRFGVDKKGQFCNIGFQIFKTEDEWPEVDLMIVALGFTTPETKMNRIDEIRNKLGTRVIALSDLLREI